MSLRPFQEAPAAHLIEVLRKHRSAVDWSITGAGKGFVGSYVAHAFGLPTLVVGPKISEASWERAAAAFDDKFTFVGYELLRAGNTPFGKWDRYKPGKEYLKCQVCQLEVAPENPAPCPHHPQGIHAVERKRKAPSYGNFQFHPAVKFLIFDEAQRAGGMDSLNAELLIAARRQNILTLALSATPAQSPLQMKALGFLLGLHNNKEDLLVPDGFFQRRALPGYYRWSAGYGCRRDERFRGWKWLVGAERQKEIMLEIRNQIIPSRGIRITAEDIPNFPERLILPELYSLDDPEAVDSCYKEMETARAALREKAAADKNPEGALTKILRERQEVELLKVPMATEVANDDLEKGYSIAFFVSFRATIDELKKRFPGAGIIDGSPESVRERQSVVDRFQRNELRELIVNCEAGGVNLSLHDLDGSFPRAGIVFPGFSATTFKQLCGRFQREGGKSTSIYRVLFAAKTVEEKIWRSLSGKLDCLDALVDGDLQPENLRI